MIYLDGNSFVCGQEQFNGNTGFKELGSEAILFTFFIVLVLTMVGLWNPIVAILMAIVAIIASVLLKFFFLSWFALITIIILGIIAMYRVGKR